MIKNYHFFKVLKLIRYGQLASNFVNQNLQEKDLQKWDKFAKTIIKTQLHRSRIEFGYIDRSGVIPSLMPTSFDPLPCKDKSYNNKNYLDVCLARAQDLLDTGQHINILWSGGLDSTLVLFAFLHQASNKEQLSIVCTFNSIVESGKIFDRYILPSGIRIKFDTTALNVDCNYQFDDEDPTQLYVNGQCGDQMFGPRISLASNASSVDHWSAAYPKEILDILEPTLKYSARPIETIRDIRWWMFFNFTWTTVYYDGSISRQSGLASRIVPFYGTDSFQTWSANTDTWYNQVEGYRTPARQALSQLIDYQYYINNKEKVWSLSWLPNPNWYAIDENFKTYYTTDK